MDAERELVDSFLLHADVVDADLGVGDTSAVAGLRVGLPLDLTVASRRSYIDLIQSTTTNQNLKLTNQSLASSSEIRLVRCKDLYVRMINRFKI